MSQVIKSRMGETFIIRQNALQTKGEFIEIDIEVNPGKQHRPLHYHPKQSEYFKMLEGSLTLYVNNEVKALHAGDEITILPNTHHYYSNESSQKAVLKTRLSPALDFEDFLRTITSLETTVAMDVHGVPENKLVAAQFIHTFKNIMQPSDIPKPVVRFVFPVLSFISKLLGDRLPKSFLVLLSILLIGQSSFAQNRFPKNEISINGFRNPSIGLEYHQQQVSVHAGYYITNFTSGVTTKFVKTGVTYWFLPTDKKEIPSSFYAGVSYLYGINRDYKKKSAVAAEAGFRWMVWKGLNLRLGVIALGAKGQDIKVNPTPGISYSFTL